MKALEDTRISLALLLLSGTLYVGLGSLRVGIAENAAGQGVLYLVVAPGLPVYDDGVVALTDLLDSVLRLLHVLAQLKLRALLGHSLVGQGLLLCAPP